MPKLPDFIFDSHKRYKADTNQLTAWLVETAQGLGYGEELSSFSDGEQSPRTGPTQGSPVKGKARKQAPDHAPAQETASSGAEYKRIFVSEFTELARFIAGCHPRIKIPSLVLKLTRSAIAVRKRCAEWFKNQATQEEDIIGKTHWHFITVLEEVVQILNPLCDSTKSATVDTSSTATFENPFSLLDIQETTDEELFETLPPPVAQRPHQLVVYSVADEDSDEWLLAVFCVFEDLRDIRTFLRVTWSDYRDKKTDVITASATTNMAFDVLRSAQDGLLALNPKLDNYEKIAYVIYSAACKRRGVDPSAKGAVDMLYLNMINVDEFVYLPTYILLQKFSEVIQPGTVPVKPAHFDNYDPHQRRELMSLAQKRREDRLILDDMIPAFISLTRLEAPPVPDELTKELKKMVLDKEISLLLVFAVQVHLDIHHVLREQVGRGFADLRSAGVQWKRSLRLRSQNSPSVQFVNWPDVNEECVQNLDRFIQVWILKDYLGPVYHLVQTEGYYLLTRHPFLCGMIQFRLQLEFQALGLELASAWGTILYVSHLYEAGKHAGFLALDSWKDMEWVMKVHDKERIFRGRVPQNVKESFKTLCLVAGISTSYFASSSRGKKKQYSRLKQSPKGPSGLKENSPVSTLFGNRIHQGGVALTAETMEELLADVGVDSYSLERSKSQTKLQRQWDQCHKMTPLQFLATLRAALVAEQDMIRFDYVSLHMRCLQLLREIKVTLHDTFVQQYGERYIENETQLAWLVGFVLSPSMASYTKSNETFTPACQVVDGFIQREGRAECSKLEKALQKFESVDHPAGDLTETK